MWMKSAQVSSIDIVVSVAVAAFQERDKCKKHSKKENSSFFSALTDSDCFALWSTAGLFSTETLKRKNYISTPARGAGDAEKLVA